MHDPQKQPLEPHQCINCHAISETPHCPVCGQKMTVPRITFTSLSNDLQERIIGLDGRFGRTFLDTIVKPGQVAKEFIAGNRRKYLSPIGYFFIILTAYLLIMGFEDLTPFDLSNQGIELSNSTNSSPKSVEFKKVAIEKFGSLFNDYFRIVSFFTVFLSGFLVWLFNRKKGYNLTETMVFAFYAEAVIYIFSIFGMPFVNTDHQWIIFVSGAASFIFFIYAYMDFFQHRSRVVGILKGLIIRFLVFFLIGFIVALFMLGYLLMNKEVFFAQS